MLSINALFPTFCLCSLELCTFFAVVVADSLNSMCTLIIFEFCLLIYMYIYIIDRKKESKITYMTLPSWPNPACTRCLAHAH